MKQLFRTFQSIAYVLGGFFIFLGLWFLVDTPLLNQSTVNLWNERFGERVHIEGLKGRLIEHFEIAKLDFILEGQKWSFKNVQITPQSLNSLFRGSFQAQSVEIDSLSIHSSLQPSLMGKQFLDQLGESWLNDFQASHLNIHRLKILTQNADTSFEMKFRAEDFRIQNPQETTWERLFLESPAWNLQIGSQIVHEGNTHIFSGAQLTFLANYWSGLIKKDLPLTITGDLYHYSLQNIDLSNSEESFRLKFRNEKGFEVHVDDWNMGSWIVSTLPFGKISGTLRFQTLSDLKNNSALRTFHLKLAKNTYKIGPYPTEETGNFEAFAENSPQKHRLIFDLSALDPQTPKKWIYLESTSDDFRENLLAKIFYHQNYRSLSQNEKKIVELNIPLLPPSIFRMPASLKIRSNKLANVHLQAPNFKVTPVAPEIWDREAPHLKTSQPGLLRYLDDADWVPPVVSKMSNE